MQSWCRIWPPNGSSRIRAKQKLHRKRRSRLQKFLEPNRKPKVIYTDTSLEFGKSCEELSWNHCTSTTHTDQKQNGTAERAVRGSQGSAHLRYCCNQVWTKNGGRILWNVTAICETFKISCLMGRCHMKGGLECPFQRSSNIVWSNG